MSIGFPKNPEDGEVFEVTPEVIYQYSLSKRCWNRISGANNITTASVSEAGLMTKEDFAKVEDILLPSFSTTLTTEECDTTFKEGRVELVSTKAALEITEKLKLFNPNGSIQENEFIIHDNTIGIDFRINIPQLIDELKKRGNFTVRETPGDPGDPGDQGDPGIDRLDTGPVGEDGPAGANAPFAGALIEDLNESLPTNKAVVDVVNDPTNPSKIIVTIGNIGNPDVGPKTVSWKDKNSNWILGLSEAPFVCPNLPPECVPTGQLFHLDLEPIIDKLVSRADKILDDLREEKQGLANNFILALAKVFAQQRQAVCCALEAVISRKVNQNIRNIWSNGRYQAAQAGYAFSVSDQIDELQPRTDPQQDPAQFVPQTPVGPAEQNVVINGNLDLSPIQFGCRECYVDITLNRTNLGSSRSVKLDLPAFDYVFTIAECCIFHDGVGGTGVFNVVYNDPENGVKTVRLNDRGFFLAGEDREQYIGDSLAIRHDGGQVEVYLDPVPSFGSGNEIKLCLQPSTCFQSEACIANSIECDSDFFIVGQEPGKTLIHALGDNPTDVTLIYDFFDKRSTLNVYHPPTEDSANLVGTTGSVLGTGSLTFPYTDLEENGTNVLIVVTTDEVGAEFTYALGCSGSLTNTQFPSLTSMISVSHAEFYERGWRTKNACGVYVEVGGSEFLVVFRSIGADCSCGGGEYSNTPFISDFINANGQQPALAWPTTDGETFFGLPRGESAFIEVEVDKTLTNMIIDKIQSGDVLASLGDTSVITSIAFPVI